MDESIVSYYSNSLSLSVAWCGNRNFQFSRYDINQMYLKRSTLDNFRRVIVWKYLIRIMTGVPDDETQSTLTKSTTVKGEKVDEIFQEQTLKEEESAAMDNSESCKPENELTQTATFLEVRQQ